MTGVPPPKFNATGHPRLQGLQLPKPIDGSNGVALMISKEGSHVKRTFDNQEKKSMPWEDTYPDLGQYANYSLFR